MLDREKVETILRRRFAGATRDQAAAAVNAIMGLSDEWEEVLHENEPLGHHFSNACGQLCYLTADLEEGTEYRLFSAARRFHAGRHRASGKGTAMSGGRVTEALRARFDAVRRSELDRLSRKLSGLSDTDRRSVESIVAHVVDALVRVPSHGLADASPPETLRAIVHLFDLQPGA